MNAQTKGDPGYSPWTAPKPKINYSDPNFTEAGRVSEALSHIPAHDRELWVKVGMAVKSALGEQGLPIWMEWSRAADNFNERDARDVWKSIKPIGGIGAGTLFHLAREYGWSDDRPYTPPTAEELAERERLQREYEAHQQQRHAEAVSKTRALLAVGNPDTSGNPYSVRKSFKIPHGAAVTAPVATITEILGYHPQAKGTPLQGEILILPIQKDGEIVGAELIDEAGRKCAIAGSIKAGACWMPATIPTGAKTIAIGEGAATVLTVTEATGWPVTAALSSSNLLEIAMQVRRDHPGAEVVVCADLNKATRQPDPHAAKAAEAVGGRLAVPDLKPEEGTDFNDLAAVRGLDAVRAALMGAERPAFDWAEPQPLAFTAPAEPYPIDALPAPIRAAVEEVASFTKAPLALVAGSALGAVSIACQSLIDVARADRLTGPVSVNPLTIADSGERKSTVDSFFTKAIREHEQRVADAMAPALAEYAAELATWEAKRTGAKDAIRQAAKQGKPATLPEATLRDLERNKPKSPKVPRLLFEDTTPEATAYRLATGWPTAGILSSEAGAVLGSHAMGKDSMMRNLSLLNVLWDGGSLTIDRKTTESFTLRNARLTVSLLIQEATLRGFFDRSDGLARGTGFFARFLLAWPESTQGTRFFSEAPAHWPALAEFHRRLGAILETPPSFDESGVLRPALLTFTAEEKSAWIAYHDAIEAELRSGGELFDVRDVASKSADNAARLAALFTLFETGAAEIEAETFEGAARLAAWHLNESRRFFGELAQAAELADAARLDDWLLTYLRREGAGSVPKNYVRQYGPLRDGSRLDNAIKELDDLDRLRLFKEGRRTMIEVNPALLEPTA